MDIAYGTGTVSEDDPLVQIAETATRAAAEAAAPGAFLVDVLPFCSFAFAFYTKEN